MAEPDSGLRARLVEVGVDLLARKGTPALSLREIARQAGVSHGAPRRHFPTHQALLAAIAAEGYAGLGQQVAAVLAGREADPRARLLALGRLYLDFARTNPAMYDLMFRHDLLQGNQIGLRDASRPLFRVLVDLVRPIRGAGPPGPAVVAGALWANLHGIAQLWRWGSLQLAVETDDLDQFLRTTLDAHLGPARRRSR